MTQQLHLTGVCVCVWVSLAAIVRSVDLIRKLIYVLTPLSLDELVEVKFLLQGRVKLPVPMLQVQTGQLWCFFGLAVTFPTY